MFLLYYPRNILQFRGPQKGFTSELADFVYPTTYTGLIKWKLTVCDAEGKCKSKRVKKMVPVEGNTYGCPHKKQAMPKRTMINYITVNVSVVFVLLL